MGPERSDPVGSGGTQGVTVRILSGCFPGPDEGDRGWRLRQLIRCLRETDATVHLTVHVEDESQAASRRGRERALDLCDSVEISVRRSRDQGFWQSLAGAAAGWLGRGESSRGGAGRRRRGATAGRRILLLNDPRWIRLTRRLPVGPETWLDIFGPEAYLSCLRQTWSPCGAVDPAAGRRRLLRGLRAVDRVLVPSRADARLWESMVPEQPLSIVPYASGWSCDEPLPLHPGAGRPPVILQLASLAASDLDAVRYFRRRLLPRIRQRVPTVRFRVIGPACSRLEAGPDVELFEFLDDLDVELSRSLLVVFPHRTGAYVRAGLVEALARGKAVVMTRCGAHGLELTSDLAPGLVEEASDVVDAVVRVLLDAGKRQILERAAWQLHRRGLTSGGGASALADLLDVGKPRVAVPADGSG